MHLIPGTFRANVGFASISGHRSKTMSSGRLYLRRRSKRMSRGDVSCDFGDGWRASRLHKLTRGLGDTVANHQTTLDLRVARTIRSLRERPS
jgi:hypothetical protein